ncbi:MAG TPA: hypothetical protein VFW09_03780 [Solirubrobacteraceae bacterium]|nr:hypothetical protein [Solirubrobacteraceae bacterium]
MGVQPVTATQGQLVSLIAPLLARDPGGRSWLPALLGACPGARARLGELVDEPGWLEVPLAVQTASGLLGAFCYPSAASRELLRWYVDHPERLTRPATDGDASPEMRVLRRALLDDDPPGSRARAQDRAHDLLRASTPRAPTWWRFEEPGRLDCVLLTDRLAVSITAPDERGGLRPATPWYPSRSELVRDLEAARRLAGGRAWAGLLLSDAAPPPRLDADEPTTVEAGTPHLDEDGRADVAGAYLGRLTPDQVRAAVG